MSVRLKVLSEIETVAAQQEKRLAPLQDELVLMESGLDSLCFALLVVKLEDSLGCDPFTASCAEMKTAFGESLASSCELVIVIDPPLPTVKKSGLATSIGRTVIVTVAVPVLPSMSRTE